MRMERMRTSTTAGTTGASNAHDPKCAGVGRDHSDASRALRNTYALLAVTLLFSAAVAAASLTLKLPAPGIILTLAGYFGLLFAI